MRTATSICQQRLSLFSRRWCTWRVSRRVFDLRGQAMGGGGSAWAIPGQHQKASTTTPTTESNRSRNYAGGSTEYDAAKRGKEGTIEVPTPARRTPNEEVESTEYGDAIDGDGRGIRSHLSTKRVLQDVLKVAVWSFFAERLVQSTLVGWGQSGRVGPLEQLGGTLIQAEPYDSRWGETRAVLKGIRTGRDTIHLNTHKPSPEMFSKVDATEIRCSSAPPGSAGKERGGLSDGEGTDLEEPLLFQEYAGPAFAHLRGLYGMSSEEYRRSFAESSRMIAHASNSKSSQSFMFSEDGKYMIKTASESELNSMLRLLPLYADHVSRRRGSLITRFYGIYRITNLRNSKSTNYVVSSNVFSTEKRLHERYDLKGSVIGRRASLPNSGTVKPTMMMKDLDLAEGTDGKISLAPGCKKRLMAEIVADVDFLTSLGVMDYSLLVGIHRPPARRRKTRGALSTVPLTILSWAAKPVWTAGCFVLGYLPGGARRGGRRPQVGVYPGSEPGVVYYMGIIDVLQRYNLQKILERGAKSVIYDRHKISAVPPEEYRDRFIKFIDDSTE